MRYLKDLKLVDWRRLGDEYLEVPALIRQYIGSPNSEERIALVAELLENVLPDYYLTEATSCVAEFMIPLLLGNEKQGDQGLILAGLADACRSALEHGEVYYPRGSDPLGWSIATLQAIEEGFPAFMRIFGERPSLRNVVALIVTCYPHRAKEYVPLLTAHYHETQDQFERAELLVCLDRVASHVPSWDEVLMSATASGSSPTLRYVATSLWVVHHGLDTPGPLLSFLESISPQDVPHAPVGLRDMQPSATDILRRALKALPRDRRISMLMSILPLVTSTYVAHRLVQDLVGAASNQPGLRLVTPLGSAEIVPLGGAALKPPKVGLDAPDWISTVVNCEPFWTSDTSGRSVSTNLFALFGLPSTRAGLVELWESTYGRLFPFHHNR